MYSANAENEKVQQNSQAIVYGVIVGWQYDGCRTYCRSCAYVNYGNYDELMREDDWDAIYSESCGWEGKKCRRCKEKLAIPTYYESKEMG